MLTFSPTSGIRKQSGMMLLEVLISIVIFSIGVLGMVMMQSMSSANSVNSEDRTKAAMMANDLIAELWANNSEAAPSDYSTWVANVADPTISKLKNGKGTLTTTGNVALVSVTWDAQVLNKSVQKAQFVTQVTIQ
jgi:type IV pilus assembly protein PilV